MTVTLQTFSVSPRLKRESRRLSWKTGHVADYCVSTDDSLFFFQHHFNATDITIAK